MGITQATHAPVGEPFLCLELGFRHVRHDRQLTVVASLAGRESVSIRRWRLDGYLPSSAQVSDIAAYIAKLVTEQSLMFIGAQDPLPT